MRPEAGREPRVEGVLVLADLGGAARLTRRGGLDGDRDALAGVAVPDGDAVPPPDLAGDAPVADVLHPVEVGALEALRDELDVAVGDDLDRGLRERLRVHPPLHRDQRLDDRPAALAVADGVGVRLFLLEAAGIDEVRDHALARLEAVEVRVLPGQLVHRAVGIHDRDDLEVVALPDLEVDGVVAGGDLQRARAAFDLDGGVRDDRDEPPVGRHGRPQADEVAVAVVVRVDGDGGVRRDRLRAGGGDDDVLAGGCALGVHDRVADVPERARLVLVVDLDVGDGGAAVDAPIDEALGAVDEAVVVEVLEGGADGELALLVHRERLARPVRRGAQAAVLQGDATAALADELPGALQERLAADVVAGDALARQVALDDGVHGDGGVVDAGLPEGVVAEHAVPAGEGVLDRGGEGVPHVQLTGEVGRRHDDRERLRVRGAPAGGLEEATGLPPLVQRDLDRLRLVGGGHVRGVEFRGGAVGGGVVGHRAASFGGEQQKRPGVRGVAAGVGASSLEGARLPLGYYYDGGLGHRGDLTPRWVGVHPGVHPHPSPLPVWGDGAGGGDGSTRGGRASREARTLTGSL